MKFEVSRVVAMTTNIISYFYFRSLLFQVSRILICLPPNYKQGHNNYLFFLYFETYNLW